MLDLIVSAVQLLSGIVILLASLMVLKVGAKGEMSLRAVAAMLVGIGGAVMIGSALTANPVPHWCTAILPLGVALWIVHAARRHKGVPMRRVTDFAALYDDHATFRPEV